MADGRNGKPRGPRVSATDRRAQYLSVASDLIVREGVDAVTMEAVAAGAGVNKALLYRQFSNRGDLLLALYEQETKELDRRVVAAIESADTFDDKVRAWVHVWFNQIAKQGRLLGRLMEARTVAGQVETSYRDRQRRIAKGHGAWYARHLGLSEDVARDAAAMLFAALSGAIERWVAAPTAATRNRLEATYVDIVLGGLSQLAAAPVPSNGGAKRPSKTGVTS